MKVTIDRVYNYDDYSEIEILDRYGNIKGYTKIDIEDVDGLIGKNIFLMSTGYVSIYPGNVGIHRFLLNAKNGELVDHINGDRSDNRRKNIRITDNSKNGINRAKHSNNKTGHRGVFYCNNIGKYNAYITINWNRKSLGYYTNIQDAINARLDAEKKYYGDYAPDNDRYNSCKYKRTEKKYKEKS